MWRRLLATVVGLGMLIAPFISLPPRTIGPLEATCFLPEQGHAFVVDLAPLGVASTSDDGGVSELVLLEDGAPLPLPHQMHAAIRQNGNGRYSHWNQSLYLSTSDNTDPHHNGRAYTLQAPRGLEGMAALVGPWTTNKVLCLVLLGTGLLLVLLPWSPLTSSEAQVRGAWLQLRTAPFLFVTGVLVFIVYLLRLNIVDVTSLSGRAIHGCLLGFVVVLFFGNLFWNWRVERRHRFSERLNPSSRPLIAIVGGVLNVGVVLAGVECAARIVPVFDSFAVNPGTRFFWPEYWEPPNSLGYNDREPGPKHGPRILVLGDSYTEGAGVRRHERFADRLQALLSEKQPGVEVFAGGRCGFDTQDEADLLERTGDAVQPDVVVVCYVLNDAERGSSAQFEPPGGVLRFAAKHLRSYAIYRCQSMARCASYEQWPRIIQAQHHPSAPGWQSAVHSLERIARWCDDRGVRKMLIVLPVFCEGTEDCRDVMDHVARAARERGFEAHNLLDDFAARCRELALSRFDAHPGAEAHAITARKLAQLIGSLNVR